MNKNVHKSLAALMEPPPPYQPPAPPLQDFTLAGLAQLEMTVRDAPGAPFVARHPNGRSGTALPQDVVLTLIHMAARLLDRDRRVGVLFLKLALLGMGLAWIIALTLLAKALAL